MWKSYGKTALFATASLRNKVKMRAAMEHMCPDVPLILNALGGSLVV